MGFFNVKDDRFDGIENELVVVKGDVAVLEKQNEVLVGENAMLKENYSLLERKNTSNAIEIDDLKCENTALKNEQKELNHRLKLIEEMLAIRKDEQEKHDHEVARDVIMDAKFNNDWLTITNMCKLLKIKNQTKLKYYLYDCGVYDININIDRNTFSVDGVKLLNECPEFIRDKYMIEDGKLLLHVSLVDYFKEKDKQMTDAYAKCLRKNAKYKQSKKELESKIVEDYQDKINQICGTSKNGGYNKERWAMVYNVFRKSYPMLDNNYANYQAEFGYVSKVRYVVTQMGLGNYLLKIACELYA